MQLNALSFIRPPFRSHTASELLPEPVDVLIGVTDGAARALADIGIRTVFDLGTSWLFEQADKAASVETLNQVPPGVLIDSASNDPPAGGGPADLRGLSQAKAAALEDALGITTIGELVNWPPRQAARCIVLQGSGLADDEAEDPDAERLRPKMGEFPTERVYYNHLMMLGSDHGGQLTELNQPLTDDPLYAGSAAFGKPAVGVLVTMAQSWHSRGVTLGHMLHSLALAPGEATRIAVIDWSRRSSARVAESITEAEELDSAATHSRSISEVQNAVAREFQHGGSLSSGWAKSTSEGKSRGFGVGGGAAGGVVGKAAGALGFSVGGGRSIQESESNFSSQSTSWSSGNKSVSASLTQNVNDRTQQYATSVRNRRASAVREVSQTESESISTRVVANYNHMHALTVQYYEVVQLYRVTTRVHQTQRVLFLPFALIDFNAHGGRAVDRFRRLLAGAALTDRAFDLLANRQSLVTIREAGYRETSIRIAGSAISAGVGSAVTSASASPAASASPGSATASPVGPETIVRKSRVEAAVVASIPGSAEISRISFSGSAIESITLEKRDQAAVTLTVPESAQQASVPSGVLMHSLARIKIAQDPEIERMGSIEITARVSGKDETVRLDYAVDKGRGSEVIAYFSGDQSSADARERELLDHLMANQSYYTQAIYSGLDSASLVMLLAGSSWQGNPLIDQIEPVPLAVAGNFLVLKAPVEDKLPSGLPGMTWKELLDDKELLQPQVDERLIPIPTGGVFAEAVLGRSNSAERLDLGRFWNWQDSPIPLAPPEITGITPGSRFQQEALEPGKITPALTNTATASELPAPASLSGALQTLAAANLFRDMSGLEGTQTAGSGLAAGTLSAATEAGKLASQNFKISAEQATKMAEIAANMWNPMKSEAGISGEGAKSNEAKAIDKENNKKKKSGQPATESTPPMSSGETAGKHAGTERGSAGETPSLRQALLESSSWGFSPTAWRASIPAGAMPASAGSQSAGAQIIDHLGQLKSICQDLKSRAGQAQNAAQFISTLDEIDAARTALENDPEDRALAVAWARKTAEGFGKLKNFVPNIQPAAISTYLKGALGAIPNHVNALIGLLEQRVRQIERASKPGTVTLDSNTSCENTTMTQKAVDLYIKTLDASDTDKRKVFEAACHSSVLDALKKFGWLVRIS